MWILGNLRCLQIDRVLDNPQGKGIAMEYEVHNKSLLWGLSHFDGSKQEIHI